MALKSVATSDTLETFRTTFNGLSTDVGDLGSLTTNNKTSIIAAVNEARSANFTFTLRDASSTTQVIAGTDTLNVIGSGGITATVSATDTLTIGADTSIATLTGSQVLTNKTLTTAVLNTGLSGTAVLDEDTMSSNSATKIATQQSIKAYVDTEIGNLSSTLTIRDDSSTTDIVTIGTDILSFAGGTGITSIITAAASTTVYTVTVSNPGSGNRFYIDGVLQATLNLFEGNTYIFNYPSGHPFKFSTTSNGTHGGGSEYTTGVTHNSSTQVTIVVATGAPTLYYYCSSHSAMGGTANTPASTFIDNTVTFNIDSTVATLIGSQTLTNKTLTSPKIGTNILDVNGLELLNLTATSSAVNELTLANAATGNNPTFTASGGDTNIGISILPKGSGKITLDNLTLPAADGTADQILTTNGSGQLSFVDNSGGTSWVAGKTSSFNVAAGEGYFVDTSSNVITATLPASPTIGDEASFVDVAGTFDTNSFTVARNGKPIQGSAADLTVSVERAGFTLVFYNDTQGWVLKDK